MGPLLTWPFRSMAVLATFWSMARFLPRVVVARDWSLAAVLLCASSVPSYLCQTLVTVRAYVDDFAVTARAPSAWGVVSLLGSALPALRTYMLSKGMVASDPKEQFYSPQRMCSIFGNGRIPVMLGPSPSTPRT